MYRRRTYELTMAPPQYPWNESKPLWLGRYSFLQWPKCHLKLYSSSIHFLDSWLMKNLLSNCMSRITCLLQVLRKYCMIQEQSSWSIDWKWCSLPTNLVWIHSSHQSWSGWSTWRLYIVSLQNHPFFGQFVNIWSQHIWIVISNVIVTFWKCTSNIILDRFSSNLLT